MVFKRKSQPSLPPDFRKVRFGFSQDQVKAAETGLEPNQIEESLLSYSLGLLDLIWDLDYHFGEGLLVAATLSTETTGIFEGLPYYHVLKGLLTQKYGSPYLKDFASGGALLNGWFGDDVLVLLKLEGAAVTVYYTPPISAQGFDLLEL